MFTGLASSWRIVSWELAIDPTKLDWTAAIKTVMLGLGVNRKYARRYVKRVIDASWGRAPPGPIGPKGAHGAGPQVRPWRPEAPR
jgi:hypothetical protein